MSDPEPLSDAETQELTGALNALEAELRGALEAARNGAKPVDLDEPIGRLSRMDAIQQSAMAAAHKRRITIRLGQITAARIALAEDRYGECVRCEEPIGVARLRARPESPTCVICLTAIEARRR